MDCVCTDRIRQLGENRGEGKTNDRKEEGSGEASEQAGAKGDAAMETKHQEGEGHGCQQRWGWEEFPQKQLVDAPEHQHTANLPGIKINPF